MTALCSLSQVGSTLFLSPLPLREVEEQAEVYLVKNIYVSFFTYAMFANCNKIVDTIARLVCLPARVGLESMSEE